MRRFKKYTFFFLLGGVGYCMIELLWRGRTHPTMLVAGGICFLLFSFVAELCKGFPLLFKALVCAVGITLIELLFGILFNLWLHMHIWDYSQMPCNLWGQVCLHFFFLWVLLSLFALPLVSFLNKRLPL